MSEPLDDLRAALGAVEPSVGFEQRTLRHIAEAGPRRAGRHWLFAAPTAAAVMLIVVTVLRSGGPVNQGAAAPGSGFQRTQAALPGRSKAEPENQTDRSTREPSPRVVRPHVERPSVSRARLRIPETAHVDQVLAVRRLVALVRTGMVLGASDDQTFREDGSIAIPALIELKPIVITPLAAGQGGGSER